MSGLSEAGRTADQQPSTDDRLAVDIGRAYLAAQQAATRLVSAAQIQAEDLARSTENGSSINRAELPSPDTSPDGALLAYLHDLLVQLDEVEVELRDRQAEMKAFLDHFVRSRGSTGD